MNQKKEFRNNGAIGALLDEYEKSLNELIETINDISENELAEIIDFETNDEDCKSIQNILTHVVQSGYTYVVEIRKWLGENVDYKNKIKLQTAQDYKLALNEMFKYNEQLFFDYPNLELCENDPKKKISVRWGQNYDVEQLLEHAIVHILRHRRQIEKFKEKKPAANNVYKK
ncbi:DinB family protein [Paenimyroides aestuarii]|uniref:DinB family protein n=1 Tax=Paenimyroides aestuarii TaxID=2968490 RepID=A0ABY5NQJ6_9FLAO|nr:DinB family protein [Paenimyroides aestuarii]UUV20762.1 DinB family protein [Paenimyroides aestuarii]